ncbi:DUF4357 domain-containing protein [Streptomyces triticagri]|uniref:DUF4357 domain-containing protein n=1 Tax=Streptomyces triticagri TaxID=2293568 RepID=A0A372LWN2_9ACTN|nr:DUF4357 domain-containing protein [Streptomyces triticagri]RFU82800.1 DUF4357 domain-containing protein [Streptomyces triticagri]
MADEHDEYPEFFLHLPNGGPVARGRQTDEMGTNGSRKFVLSPGQPVRADVVPSFATRVPSAHRLREKLIAEERIGPSETWPDWLETKAEITFNSPSEAAAVLKGRSTNGWTSWKTQDGHPLADYMPSMGWGPARTWLVRGSHGSGPDPVKELWLPQGRVTLAASRLRPGVEQGITKDKLRTFVLEDYGATLTYSQQQDLVEELHAFLSRMSPGDTVCTLSESLLYVGEITGEAQQTDSDDLRSSLSRPVDWGETGYTYAELPEDLQQKLHSRHDVVDLTSVQSVIEGLGLTDEELADEAEAMERDPGGEHPALTARRELELPIPSRALAAELHVHDVEWLREVRDLLWDEKQLVLYGPPGTGKTYLAMKLAEALGGGPEQARVKLVQFHPAYAYEDFFEGFRPREHPETGEVAFRLTPGPLRELADLADREGSRHIPHFLIIDEINRANLAKVFGELYFLLEYRKRSVRLTYSDDDFALPANLFVIGTMNTADRSIALVDAAMRRRFAFVELSPRTEPTSGLLRRWLAAEGRHAEPADLLDALNARIDDPDFRIGPSYLMKKSVYREGGLDRTWRTKILPLLAEHHYGAGVDIERRYGLTALRRALRATDATDTPGAPDTPGATDTPDVSA